MVKWQEINTVMLDMDGTLLDLHFDNYFWLEYVPQQYAQLHNITVQQAKDQVYPRFSAAEGTMQWYCVDYWTDKLGLDIEMLKTEIKHRIRVLPNVEEFLSAVTRSGRSLLLVTNAHQKSLRLKLAHTGIGKHFDQIICSHDYGVPKENSEFWHRLQKDMPFADDSTLLIDDSLPVLKSARDYGICHLLAIHQPDSQKPAKEWAEFDALKDFKDITP